MRYKVPFYQQTNNLNCGPAALRMVLSYLDNDPGLELLEKKCGIKEGQGVATIQLATTAAKLGYKSEFYSTSLYFNKKNMNLVFYKKYTSYVHRSTKLIEEAKKAGVKIQQKSLSLDEMLSKLNGDCVGIVLLDWSIVKNKKSGKYQGHFVPIVGYTNKSIYVHNQSHISPQSYLRIDKEKFDKARKALGTDEDIAIIHRK